jgi:uncharacterized protein YjbJ (UPF0337 family)
VLKGSHRERAGRLTDQDLDVIAGKRDQLIGTIQELYGKAKEEAQKQADHWNIADSASCTWEVKAEKPADRRAFAERFSWSPCSFHALYLSLCTVCLRLTPY